MHEHNKTVQKTVSNCAPAVAALKIDVKDKDQTFKSKTLEFPINIRPCNIQSNLNKSSNQN